MNYSQMKKGAAAKPAPYQKLPILKSLSLSVKQNQDIFGPRTPADFAQLKLWAHVGWPNDKINQMMMSQFWRSELDQQGCCVACGQIPDRICCVECGMVQP
jgi:hypothetical protein